MGLELYLGVHQTGLEPGTSVFLQDHLLISAGEEGLNPSNGVVPHTVVVQLMQQSVWFLIKGLGKIMNHCLPGLPWLDSWQCRGW